MSKALIEKLLRARETKVTVDGKTYTIRRPTELEAEKFDALTGGDPGMTNMAQKCAMAQQFVVDWDLTEIDLGIPGGNPERVPFDADLWTAYVADRRDLWVPLSNQIRAQYKKHADERGESEKNS